MFKIAVIRAGKVINCILWDKVALWSPGAGCSSEDISNKPEVDIGWDYDGENFTPPPAQEAD